MKKFKLYILSFLAIIFFTYSSCNKFNNDDGPCDFMGTYEFVLPFELEPAKVTYQTGDTITISTTFSNYVSDRVTGNKYFLDDFNFYLINSIAYLDTNKS